VVAPGDGFPLIFAAAMLESLLRDQRVSVAPSRERIEVVAEGSDAARDGTSGMRLDPVAEISRNDGSLVVSLVGELDLYNANDVREVLLQCCAEGPHRLVVDLSGVKFIDSTALGVLIEARTKLENRRGFLLAAPGLETRRALKISGLDRHFVVHDSLEDALAASI
jgi:anti-sigma B factor antagonist